MLLNARNRATEIEALLVAERDHLFARVSFPRAGLTCRRHLPLGSPPRAGLPCTSHISAHSFGDMGGRENKNRLYTPLRAASERRESCFSPQAGVRERSCQGLYTHKLELVSYPNHQFSKRQGPRGGFQSVIVGLGWRCGGTDT